MLHYKPTSSVLENRMRVGIGPKNKRKTEPSTLASMTAACHHQYLPASRWGRVISHPVDDDKRPIVLRLPDMAVCLYWEVFCSYRAGWASGYMTIEGRDCEADGMPGLSRRPAEMLWIPGLSRRAAGLTWASGFSRFIHGMFWISLLLALLPLEIELTDAAGHEKRNVKYCPEVKPCICNTEVSILNTSVTY